MRVDAVRHLRGDIYEIRVRGDHVSYRLLFSAEGRYRQVLLSLVLIEKKSQKTPAQAINLAEDRLKDWRARGSSKLTRTNGKRDV